MDQILLQKPDNISYEEAEIIFKKNKIFITQQRNYWKNYICALLIAITQTIFKVYTVAIKSYLNTFSCYLYTVITRKLRTRTGFLFKKNRVFLRWRSVAVYFLIVNRPPPFCNEIFGINEVILSLTYTRLNLKKIVNKMPIKFLSQTIIWLVRYCCLKNIGGGGGGGGGYICVPPIWVNKSGSTNLKPYKKKTV